MAKATTLTAQEIIGLKPKSTQFYVYDGTRQRGHGRLAVRVNTSGQKVFCYRYFVDGKTKFIQIGIFPQTSLEAARAVVREYANQLKAGIDPKAEIERQNSERMAAEKTEAMKGSIGQLISGYVAKMKADGKRTSEDVFARLNRDVYSGALTPETKARDVTPEHIKLILAGMIERGAVVQSNRVRSYLHAAFQFGLKADNDPANMKHGVLFGLSTNPVALVPKQSAAEKPGETWLTLEQLQTLLRTFTKTPCVGWMPGKLIELCLLTGGQRPYEMAASRWTEVDWEQRTLLVTPDVSKNKRPHLIPLTNAALSVLMELKEANRENSPFIFPQRNKPSEHFQTASLARAVIYFRNHESNKGFPVFAARDLRRTCKTLMGQLGVSKELRDRIQNHALNDVSSKHYDRYSYLPEKRQALEAWETRLQGGIE